MEYEAARIAVDPVIFTIHNEQLQVLLHKREKPPFEGLFELPGGLLRPNEPPRKRLQRKLQDMVGKEDVYVDQFHVFADPRRDPRERTLSIGYIALINEANIEDTDRWFNARDLPDMAFDHDTIIKEADAFLQEHLDTVIVKQFMPPLFPLNNLQHAYEIIEQTEYDNRNFRRKMLQHGIVEETDQKQENVPHRPATLYRFTDN